MSTNADKAQEMGATKIIIGVAFFPTHEQAIRFADWLDVESKMTVNRPRFEDDETWSVEIN